MIGLGMPVQIRRCGTAIPVERLAIGDLVYDPLSDNYVELLDILNRETAAIGDQLVRLSAANLQRTSQPSDVIVSRMQPVGVIEKSVASAPAQMDFRAAYRVGEVVRMPTRLYALFPERLCCISVAGVLLQLQDMATLLAVPPQTEVARTKDIRLFRGRDQVGSAASLPSHGFGQFARKTTTPSTRQTNDGRRG